MIPGERSSENELISSILYQLRPFAKKKSQAKEKQDTRQLFI